MKKNTCRNSGRYRQRGTEIHPTAGRSSYFEVSEVAASDRSAGKNYAQAVNWFLETPIPENVAELEIKPCQPDLKCKTVFSGLDSSVAGEIETKFARAGYTVISNSKITVWMTQYRC